MRRLDRHDRPSSRPRIANSRAIPDCGSHALFLGVTRNVLVESLYRDIHALRIYEGTNEVRRLIIGRDLLREAAAPKRNDAEGKDRYGR